MSQAGKEILIKAVVQAIPTYSIGVFQLSKALCKSLNSLMSRFWWGHKANQNRIAWRSWERLSTSKFEGGMGFRDMVVFNKALLAKQGWRILSNPDSLVARILKDKYFPSENFMEAKVGNRPSYAWRSICQAWEVLKLGVGWRVGNGENIRIWGDAWLPPPHPFLLFPPPAAMDPNSKVAALIDTSTGWWSYEFINSLFDPGDVARICSVMFSPLLKPDQIVWRGNASGVFTVKSAYHLILANSAQARDGSSARRIEDPFWKNIWRLQIPPVVRQFCWFVCNNPLPTKHNLALKKVVPNPECPICLVELETVVHCLLSCPSAVAVWQESSRCLQKLALSANDG